jgi:cyclophilin family peptidyl-prolyl cis-trans isomerase
MSKKNRPTPSQQRSAKSGAPVKSGIHTKSSVRGFKTDNKAVYIQIAAAVVIVLVIVAVVWYNVANEQKAAQTSAQTTTQPAASAQQDATQPAASTQQDATQPAASTKQYASAPPISIDKSKQYTATVKMSKGGEFVIQLYPDKAPLTVNSFVFLAREKFFDGSSFHRVLEGFMAQGGDPTGTGMGGPGYKFVNEDNDLKFDKAGVVAMANAGRDTNGSQFFITFLPTPQLDGGYTIFGQVTSGMDVVNGITRRDPNSNPSFTGDVIQSVTITEK